MLTWASRAFSVTQLRARDAEHILMMLTSFESFDVLYTGQGLSTKRVIELLVETAERALYAEP